MIWGILEADAGPLWVPGTALSFESLEHGVPLGLIAHIGVCGVRQLFAEVQKTMVV